MFLTYERFNLFFSSSLREFIFKLSKKCKIPRLIVLKKFIKTIFKVMQNPYPLQIFLTYLDFHGISGAHCRVCSGSVTAKCLWAFELSWAEVACELFGHHSSGFLLLDYLLFCGQLLLRARRLTWAFLMGEQRGSVRAQGFGRRNFRGCIFFHVHDGVIFRYRDDNRNHQWFLCLWITCLFNLCVDLFGDWDGNSLELFIIFQLQTFLRARILWFLVKFLSISKFLRSGSDLEVIVRLYPTA